MLAACRGRERVERRDQLPVGRARQIGQLRQPRLRLGPCRVERGQIGLAHQLEDVRGQHERGDQVAVTLGWLVRGNAGCVAHHLFVGVRRGHTGHAHTEQPHRRRRSCTGSRRTRRCRRTDRPPRSGGGRPSRRTRRSDPAARGHRSACPSVRSSRAGRPHRRCLAVNGEPLVRFGVSHPNPRHRQVSPNALAGVHSDVDVAPTRRVV